MDKRVERVMDTLAMGAVMLGLFGLLALAGGCSSGYVVIASDREVVPVRAVEGGHYERTADKDGSATGWYVPDAVMLDLLKE